MPLNRVNNAKSVAFWLLVLDASNKKDEEEKSEVQTLDVSNLYKETIFRWWFPGLMVVPLPKAGWILGYIDVGYWAVFFYILGSIFYVIDSFYLWPKVNTAWSDDSTYYYSNFTSNSTSNSTDYYYYSTDDSDDYLWVASNPAVYFNLISAVLFVVDALICLVDWHMQVKQLSVMNMTVDEKLTGGGIQLESINSRMTRYYLVNNIFFLLAAVLYMVQGMWSMNADTDLTNCRYSFCNEFWINFWASFAYVVSSLFSIAESWEDRQERIRTGLPPLKAFSWAVRDVDWFAWGDWIYLICAAMQFGQSFFMFNSQITDDDASVFYLSSNVLYLVDAIAYYIGYILFVYDLRNALLSGTVPVNQTKGLCELIGDDHYDEGEKLIQEEESVDSSSQTSPTRQSSMIQSPVRGSVATGRRSIFEPREDTIQSATPTSSTRPSFISFTSSQGYVSTREIQAKLSEANEIRQRRRSSLMVENPVRRSLSAIPPTTVRTPSERIRSSFAVGSMPTQTSSELQLSPTNTTKLLPILPLSKDVDL